MTNRSAIGLMCMAVLCFTVLDSTAKYLGQISGMDIVMVLWLRFITHLLFLSIIYRPKGFIQGFKTICPKGQLLRTLSMVMATGFNFAALLYLQLDQTITIFFLSPLLVAALAGPILNEWLGPKRLLAVLTGFIGVLIVMRPGFGGIHWAVSLSLISTLSVSLYNVLTRYTSHYDSNLTNQIYSPLGGAIMLTPFAIYSGSWPTEWTIWLLAISLGISGGLGHWFLITAHRYAPAPILAPFIYTGILTMPIIGYLVFNDIPSIWTMAGASIVIASGLYLFFRESREGEEHQSGW